MDVLISNLVMLHESLHYFSQTIMIFLTNFYAVTNAAVVSVHLGKYETMKPTKQSSWYSSGAFLA